MTGDPFTEEANRRPGWLVTLADLTLLLLGFFVFLQANVLAPATLAAGLREGFGAAAAPAMPVDASVVAGFAPGSATLPANAARGWAREATRDPRTLLRVIGGTDGTPQDVDHATGSAAILAADRARAVAASLADTVPPARLAIETRPGAGRAVQLQIGFAGETK